MGGSTLKIRAAMSSLDMPAPARRVVRIDVWQDPTRPNHWLAGWSAMELGNGDDYLEAMNSSEPGSFMLVSRGTSDRSAILSADLPYPNVWRHYEVDDERISGLMEKMAAWETLEKSLWRATQDH